MTAKKKEDIHIKLKKLIKSMIVIIQRKKMFTILKPLYQIMFYQITEYILLSSQKLKLKKIQKNYLISNQLIIIEYNEL